MPLLEATTLTRLMKPQLDTQYPNPNPNPHPNPNPNPTGRTISKAALYALMTISQRHSRVALPYICESLPHVASLVSDCNKEETLKVCKACALLMGGASCPAELAPQALDTSAPTGHTNPHPAWRCLPRRLLPFPTTIGGVAFWCCLSSRVLPSSTTSCLPRKPNPSRSLLLNRRQMDLMLYHVALRRTQLH